MILLNNGKKTAGADAKSAPQLVKEVGRPIKNGEDQGVRKARD